MVESAQHTLKSELSLQGIGLHSGTDCAVTLRPAPLGTGVIFRRLDLAGAADQSENQIAACPSNVVGAHHGTTIANRHGTGVATIEHLMAALALCSIDNVIVDVDGPEVPICDGSSEQFVDAILTAGKKAQAAERNLLVVERPLHFSESDRSIEITPHNGRQIEIEIAFEDCMIGQQALSLDLDDPETVRKLAFSRTFCRLNEVDALKNAGLIRGGALTNSIVIDGDQMLNKDPLRDPSEFALHKALDLIGDLYLLGGPIIGRIRAVRPGHDLNTRAALQFAEQFSGLAIQPQDRQRLGQATA